MSVKVWADVPGWPGYRVSTDGEVQSCRCSTGVVTSAWKTMRCSPDGDGYFRAELSHPGRKRLGIHVHLLVLICHGTTRPPGNSMALHNNGIRTDNRLENLRWGFHQENSDDKRIHGTVLYSDRNGRAKLRWEDVRELRRQFAEGEAGIKALSRSFGIHHKQVRRIVDGVSWPNDPEQSNVAC